MDIFSKDKIKRVQDYIVELYNLKLKNGDLNAVALQIFNEKALPQWEDQLQNYSYEEIEEAINNFFKNKNNRTPPKIFQITNTINSNKIYTDLTTSSSEYVLKPICPIPEWQDDFDYVLMNACIKGIVFNPYWNSLEQVKKDRTQSLLTSSDYNNKIHWKECYEMARTSNIESFKKIYKYNDDILLYTLTYRLGYLT